MHLLPSAPAAVPSEEVKRELKEMVPAPNELRCGRATDMFLLLLPCLLVALHYVLCFASPVFYAQLVMPEHFNPGVPVLEWFQVAAYISAMFLSICTGVSLLSSGLRNSSVVCLCLALGCLFATLEEINYGQRLLNLTVPPGLAERSYQRELNIHNLKVFQPYLHRAWAAVGLIGALGWLGRRGRCTPLSVRDLLCVEGVFALFFLQLAVYYLYLDLIDPMVWTHQEAHETILAGGVFLVFLAHYRRARGLHEGGSSAAPAADPTRRGVQTPKTLSAP